MSCFASAQSMPMNAANSVSDPFMTHLSNAISNAKVEGGTCALELYEGDIGEPVGRRTLSIR